MIRKGEEQPRRTWLISGVSSGFGFEMMRQLLSRGDRVIGTVRNREKVEEYINAHPGTFDCEILDLTDVAAIYDVVNRAFQHYGKIDVLVSNAGYGLFGAAEELSDEAIDHIIATNLTGSIQFIKSAIPFMRAQGGGRIIQISSYGGQVAFPGNSMYHATKFGIEGFCESIAQELTPFNIGVTLVEPGGARTAFRYGSAKVAKLIVEYEGNPAHNFLNMLDASKGLAPGDPKQMAARIIESVNTEPAPMRLMLGSQALSATIAALKERIADYEMQTELAASTDFSI